MAEVSESSSSPNMESTVLNDPQATFDKMKDLLKAKDDTSRFVGLALLKSVLDNEQQLVKNPERIRILWESISPKFLDRLLKAQVNGKLENAQAKDMVDLAVAVLHTFATLLPAESRTQPQLVERTGPLVITLVRSSSETTQMVLETLLTIVSQVEGSLALLKLDDISPLTEIASQHPLVLDILNFTWANGSTVSQQVQTVQASINQEIPKLLLVFKGTDAVTFLSFIASLLPKLSSQALPQNPTWLQPLLLLLRNLVSSRPTLAGRAAYTQAAAALLQAYPTRCPSLLFKNSTSKDPDSKPFSYLFVNLLLIDLRSSFPSLLAKLNSSEYPSISQRLASAFDVLSSFIGFLVRSLDDESSTSFSIPPDLLLKLRKDIAETISLSIEYMRDRWDASIAGASGLHPSARAGSAATSEGTRLTLTWDSMKDDVTADPLILASIRALAIWIREDENENLRKESAGMMDMFVELYKLGSKERSDFRYPILLALEGVMITEDGVEAFLEQNGWEVVYEDLANILKIHESSTTATSELISESSRGLQIIRVLLATIDNETTTFIKEDWMSAVKATSAIKLPPSTSTTPAFILEFYVALLQLSTALLSKSGAGMQKRYTNNYKQLSKLTEQLRDKVGKLNDKSEAMELNELLEDVELDLENGRQPMS